ncbi:MAG: RNA polymerase sigma factor [Candidatus Entotheonellia bacterium]
MDSITPLTESDEALVARAKRDRDAFGYLYDRYVDQVYQFTYRRVKNHPIAEDITARVFYRALEQLPRFEWRGIPFGGWLIRIAANLIHDHNGYAQRHISLGDWIGERADMVSADPLVEEQYAARQAASVLWQAVSTLPIVEQQVLVYRFAREMSIREIATTMGRTEGAVKQLLFRAVKRLRQRLQHIGFADES